MVVYHYQAPISPVLAKASLYIFLTNCIQPTTSSLMFLWYKESEENQRVKDFGSVSRPNFSPDFIAYMGIIGYVFFVVGTLVYNKWLSHWSYRKIWATTQLLLVLVNMLDYVWVGDWKLVIFLCFVLTSTSIYMYVRLTQHSFRL